MQNATRRKRNTEYRATLISNFIYFLRIFIVMTLSGIFPGRLHSEHYSFFSQSVGIVLFVLCDSHNDERIETDPIDDVKSSFEFVSRDHR